MRGTVLLLAVLFVATTATAQSVGITNPTATTPTTLYFHLDAHQNFPINTQPPDDRFAQGETRGILAPTTTCTPDALPGQVHQQQHTLYGASTPGYVEYDFQENGGPRIHPERGLASDVHLDTASEAYGVFYLKTTVDSGRLGGVTLGDQNVNDLPVVVPQVVVQYTIRTGDSFTFDGSGYNSGSIIAQGQSAPQDLIPDQTVTPNYLPQEDGGNVYEFRVPLSLVKDTITKGDPANPTIEDSFNVRIDIFEAVPGCDADNDAAFMPGTVEIFTAPDHRPRMVLPVTNPLEINYIHPQLIGDQLFIHCSFNSPWGNYDVDEALDGITVDIDGPTDARSITRAAFTQRFHEHDHHFEPVDVTYVWPYVLDSAEKDTYTITVSAWNDQHTANAVGVTQVDFAKNQALDSDGNVVKPEQDGTKDSPIAGPVLLLGVLATALVLHRRD